MTKRERQEALMGYLGISPWVIGFLCFIGGPILASLGLSFTEYKVLSPPQWVALGNYERMFFHDKLFWHSLRITLTYSLISIPLGMCFGFSIALLMNQDVRGVSLWRTVYYLPAVVSGVAVSLLWAWIFNPEFGIANALLAKIGIAGPKWLYSRTWALPSMVIMSLWGAGGSMVIYLAGLQGIPTDLYEAASIDGAMAWHRLRHITLPLMTPVFFFQLITGMIGAFQLFTQAYVMTGGGPANATLFYVLYLYQRAFSDMMMGYASAMAWALFLVILALTASTFVGAKYWVYYETA